VYTTACVDVFGDVREEGERGKEGMEGGSGRQTYLACEPCHVPITA